MAETHSTYGRTNQLVLWQPHLLVMESVKVSSVEENRLRLFARNVCYHS